MAVTYGFFDSVNGDRKYNADQMSEFYTGITNDGVFQHIDNGLAVSAGTGLTVNVATGRALIRKKWVNNDAVLTKTISAASATYARIDAVVIRFSKSNRNISIVVKDGTPAASPSAPSMTRNSDVYEMALAYVNVAANATSVTVTDKRSDTTVCGWVSVAQQTSGEVDAMLNAMKTGFDGVEYPSPAEQVIGSDTKLQNEINTKVGNKVYLKNNIFEEDEMTFKNIVLNSATSIIRLINVSTTSGTYTVKISGNVKASANLSVMRFVVAKSSSASTGGTYISTNDVTGEFSFEVSATTTEAAPYLNIIARPMFGSGETTGDVIIDNLLITINGTVAPVLSDIDASNGSPTYDYNFLLSGKPAIATKESVDFVKNAATIEKDGYYSVGANYNTNFSYGANEFYGFRYPITKIDNIARVSALLRLGDSNASVNCKLYDSSLNLLGSTSAYAGTTEETIDFYFASPVTITTDFGFIEFSCVNKLYREDARDIEQNVEIMPPITSNTRGYYSNGSTWSRLTTSQTKQFALYYKIYKNGKYDEAVSKVVNNEVVIHNKVNVFTAQELVDTLHRIATTKANNIANKNNVYDVYLNSGTYELYGVLDLTDIEDQTPFKRGLEVPDYVNLIGIGNVTISLTIPDSISNPYLVKYLSTLNTYGENHFKNLTIIATNCRYCIHDDDGGNQTDRTYILDNCVLIHNGNSIATDLWPSNSQIPYGSGHSGGRHGIFKNCVFKAYATDAVAFYAHTSSSLYMKSPCVIDIDHCAFICDDSDHGIDFNPLYNVNLINVMSVNNSKVDNIYLHGTNPARVFGGGNTSTLTITNENSSEVYLV